MTPGESKYNAIDVGRSLLELVKLELLMKKHFVYTDDIDELRGSGRVVGDFDKAIARIRSMIQKLKALRNSL